MNIAEAKQEIKNTLRAYTAKDEEGNYKIPVQYQRPVLLIGPPGIGKTAIMKQIAEEENIGLVEYTLTHHTRQSAVGLPILEKKRFQGEEYTVTEYTMSEMIASVYECIEKEGAETGILFLDEINCVSETLAPTMLQLLQNKTFGAHKLPKGWCIVAAGNPERYNKSVREFDIVTLDRVKKIEIQENHSVWDRYAAKQGVHLGIRSYLQLKPENFYRIEERQEGSCFVTARGWEDLSRILKSYEEMKVPITEDFVKEYIQHEEVAGDFYGFYKLFKNYEEKYQKYSFEEKEDMLFHADFEEKVLLMQLLEGELQGKVKEYQREKAYINGLYEELKKMKKAVAEEQQEIQSLFCQTIERRKRQEKILAEQGLLSKEKQKTDKNITKWLDERKWMIRKAGFSAVKEDFYRETLNLKHQEEQIQTLLDKEIFAVKNSSKTGQELPLFLSMLAQNEKIAEFIAEHGCESYLKESKALLLQEREAALKEEIQAFQTK
ncbi:MAG: AAA family ATPase [Bacillota bacterium]|nr:AAA family ATPase [Bacillota bacterium]